MQEARGLLEKAGMIIMNRGVWFQPMGFFARDLAATCRFLRFTFPDKLIIFRDTPPGHPYCLGCKEPLAKPQNLSKVSWYSWNHLPQANKHAKRIVESFGIVYMDVSTPTQFRPDGHMERNKKGQADCLHYCLPGPTDTWVQILYNTLVQVKN